MKKIILILMLLLPATVMAQPAIVFENVVYDFGIVNGTHSLDYTFEFQNKGNEDLIIRKLDVP